MPAFLSDIATEHLEELQFLWAQRRVAVRSPAYTMRELGMLEERIEAHVQGLLVLGGELLGFVRDALACDDEMAAFAAAFALLRSGAPAALDAVADAFATARGPRLAGLREALAHGPAQPLLERIDRLWRDPSTAAERAVAAAEVLAFHRALEPGPRLERLLIDEAPAVRAAAWRVVAGSGAAIPAPRIEAALCDEAPAVRDAALAAAAWTAYPGFVAHCRSLAAAPSPAAVEPLVMLAAVAAPGDVHAFAALVASPSLGNGRFRVLGAYGHPALADYCLREMESDDVATAAAAGAAFAKLTGVSVDAGRRATVPPEPGTTRDAFDEEFADEVQLPDPALARRTWERLAPSLGSVSRVCRGLDMSVGLTRDVFAALDMESRRELLLRARLVAGWDGSPLLLERFPQRA